MCPRTPASKGTEGLLTRSPESRSAVKQSSFHEGQEEGRQLQIGNQSNTSLGAPIRVFVLCCVIVLDT